MVDAPMAERFEWVQGKDEGATFSITLGGVPAPRKSNGDPEHATTNQLLVGSIKKNRQASNGAFWWWTIISTPAPV